MIRSKVDHIKLKHAIERFGSLLDAIQHLEKERDILEKKKAGLSKKNVELKITQDKLSRRVKGLKEKIESYTVDLRSLYEQIIRHSRQYELFCGFMAMSNGSPSIGESLRNLIALFEKLLDTGWLVSKKPEDMRSLFVSSVMGDYLKCFRCDSCGAKFIVNRDPQRKFFGQEYCCPICNYSFAVKPDDSFLRAMVSEEQLENTHRIGEVLKENEALIPLRVFLDMPCEICGKPVNEWDEQNVKLVITGMGCSHTSCWNSQSGQWRQMCKTIIPMR